MRGGVNAQPQELKRDLGSFKIIPKNLTTDGVAKAYIVEGTQGYYYREQIGDVTLKVLDENFNTEKTFGYSLAKNKEWTSTKSEWSYNFKLTQSDVENAQLVREEGEPEKQHGEIFDTVYVGTMEEFKDLVESGYYNLDVPSKYSSDDRYFFIDHNGNWSVGARSNNGTTCDMGALIKGLELQDGTESSDVTLHGTFDERYYYYDRTDSCVYEAHRIMEFDRVFGDADFGSVKTTEVNNREQVESLYNFDITDADNNGVRMDIEYLTQNLLNDDDKYECFIVRHIYEPVPATPTFTVGREYTGYYRVSKIVRENDYDIVGSEIEAVNEDGSVLFRLSVPYKWPNLDIYVLNGKRYLEIRGYLNSEKNGIIYLIDPKSPDGVKEVARTKSAEVTKTYNAAGIQVDKDAKGIVITDNGMKYINR